MLPVSLLFIVLAVLALIYLKVHRKTMLWAGLLIIPALLTNLLFTAELPLNNLGIWRFLLTQGLTSISLAVILAGLYEWKFKSFFSPAIHPRRSRLVLLVTGVGVSLLLHFLFDLPFVIAILVGLGLNIAIILVFDRELIWDVLFSSFGVAFLYFVTPLVVGVSLPTDLQNFWLTNTLTGLTLFSRPIELLIGLALFGFLWGPIYVVLKDYGQSVPDSKGLDYLTPKIITSHLLLTGVLVVFCWAVYQFVLPPRVLGASPSSERSVSLDSKIQVRFNKPIKEDALRVRIEPHIPGSFRFEDTILNRRFFKTITFYPDTYLKPSQDYQIIVEDIQTILSQGKGTYKFQFTTMSIPTIVRSSVADKEKDVSTCQSLDFFLDQEATDLVDFDFRLDPAIESDIVHKDSKTYTFKPKECLGQGVTYALVVDRVITLHDGDYVTSQSQPEPVYQLVFTTKSPPKIASYSPIGQAVLTSTRELVLIFSEPMPQEKAVKQLNLSPPLAGFWRWENETKLVYIITEPLKAATTYSITLPKGIEDQRGGFLEEDIRLPFTTLGPVQVTKFSPKQGATGISTSTEIKISFDQPIDEASAISLFTLEPSVNGTTSWQGNTLIFKPAAPLPKDTSYTITIRPGVKAIQGADSVKQFTASFVTEESVTLLAIGLDYQDKALSCEAAALKMALRYRGVAVSEDDIMARIGFDPTPRQGHIWGDPDAAFVGDINGAQNSSGYGVHWEPIAKAAKTWRQANAFSNWSVEELAASLAAGNPVVIWGVQGRSSRDDWQTPAGRLIKAWKGEHVRTVVGFRGNPANPRQFILNDPIAGRLTWSTAQLQANWGTFNNSGVVVY